MSLRAFLTIIRPANALVGSLTVIIGILTAYRIISSTIGSTWNLIELIFVLLAATLTYFCIASAGNVVNDIYDLEVDKVNRPTRPLPSGAMTVRQAKVWTATLVVLGLIISILTIPLSAIGIWTLVIVILFAIVGLFYAAKGKVMGLFGNFAVSVSFAFGLFYGTLVTSIVIPPVIFVYFITAASVLQGREIIKGIEDIEGDSLRNVQTIARKYGIKTASIIAVIFNIIGIISFYFPWFANSLGWNWTGFLYIILIIPGIGVVGASTILILHNPIKYASRASLCDKVGAFLGLTNFVLGAL